MNMYNNSKRKFIYRLDKKNSNFICAVVDTLELIFFEILYLYTRNIINLETPGLLLSLILHWPKVQ